MTWGKYEGQTQYNNLQTKLKLSLRQILARSGQINFDMGKLLCCAMAFRVTLDGYCVKC